MHRPGGAPRANRARGAHRGRGGPGDRAGIGLGSARPIFDRLRGRCLGPTLRRLFAILGGLDLATGALILERGCADRWRAGRRGVAARRIRRSLSRARSARPALTPGARPSVALAADQVATVLLCRRVDGCRQRNAIRRSRRRARLFLAPGHRNRERNTLLLPDVPVLTVDRAGPGIALTLAVPHAGALLAAGSAGHRRAPDS